MPGAAANLAAGNWLGAALDLGKAAFPVAKAVLTAASLVSSLANLLAKSDGYAIPEVRPGSLGGFLDDTPIPR